jgi:hypothetical protein
MCFEFLPFSCGENSDVKLADFKKCRVLCPVGGADIQNKVAQKWQIH